VYGQWRNASGPVVLASPPTLLLARADAETEFVLRLDPILRQAFDRQFEDVAPLPESTLSPHQSCRFSLRITRLSAIPILCLLIAAARWFSSVYLCHINPAAHRSTPEDNSNPSSPGHRRVFELNRTVVAFHPTAGWP